MAWPMTPPPLRSTSPRCTQGGIESEGGAALECRAPNPDIRASCRSSATRPSRAAASRGFPCSWRSACRSCGCRRSWPSGRQGLAIALVVAAEDLAARIVDVAPRPHDVVDRAAADLAVTVVAIGIGVLARVALRRLRLLLLLRRSLPASARRQARRPRYASLGPPDRRLDRLQGFRRLGRIGPAALRHVGTAAAALAAQRRDAGLHQVDRAQASWRDRR